MTTAFDFAAAKLFPSSDFLFFVGDSPDSLLLYDPNSQFDLKARGGDSIFLSTPFLLTVTGVSRARLVYDFTPAGGEPAVVPLPAALPLFVAGLAAIGAVARRKRQSR